MKSFRISLLSLAVLLFAAVGLLSGGAARADSWAAPEKRVTLSASGQFRFTTYPASQRAVAANDGGGDNARPHAIGRLEQKRARGGWETVWKAPLANSISPTEALVTDDGHHVVTFDNWYSTGHGANVIVIYGADGSLVRSMMLTDLVPDFYKDTLSHSVSSIWWRAGAEIAADGTAVAIDVYEPSAAFIGENKASLRFRVTLADGAVTLPPEPEWAAAPAKARRLALDGVKEALRYEFMARNPITSPETCDVRDWEVWLHEVFERQAPAGSEAEYISQSIMLPVGAEDHERRLTNFKWEPSNRFRYAQRHALVAPCAPDVLLLAAQAVAQRTAEKGETFPSMTLWVAASKNDFDRVAEVLVPTGITTIWIDPAQSIPQRADRFAKNDGTLQALEAYERRLLADIAAEPAAR
jgi:hypothetical protein